MTLLEMRNKLNEYAKIAEQTGISENNIEMNVVFKTKDGEQLEGRAETAYIHQSIPNRIFIYAKDI